VALLGSAEPHEFVFERVGHAPQTCTRPSPMPQAPALRLARRSQKSLVIFETFQRQRKKPPAALEKYLCRREARVRAVSPK
jgi:hypothetical protein